MSRLPAWERRRREERRILWAPKCICVLSHWPFFRSFRRWLGQLYALSLSSSHQLSPGQSLERHISQFMLEVPLPDPLGLPVGVALSTHTSPIVFELPPRYGLPMLDLSFRNLLLCLDVENLLNVYANLLLERKVLIRSRFASLITEVSECLLALLWPFTWQGTFIPRLTTHLLEYIHCPGSLLVGVHDDCRFGFDMGYPGRRGAHGGGGGGRTAVGRWGRAAATPETRHRRGGATPDSDGSKRTQLTRSLLEDTGSRSGAGGCGQGLM